ncbi:MAG: class C beta-lactamase [Acidobacteriaceae bacterium]
MKFRSLALACFLLAATTCASRAADQPAVRQAVDAAVRPLMQQYAIPGMAVGVVVDGKPYLFNYGLADPHSRKPVTGDTLFEVGSVSKTFTATLAAYAQQTGHLSLTDPVSRFLPTLRATPFGAVTLLELGTHTPGGMPLQVPDAVRDDAQLMLYLERWRPTCPPGACRTYSNISIGTLGLITAKSLNGNFAALMQADVFRPLGLTSTFLRIPPARIADYAEGFTRDGRPIRVAPGELDTEAYGVRTTAADLLRFLEANMSLIRVNPVLQRALLSTHTPYFHDGPMTQDLIWEQYAWPVSLDTLLAGNSGGLPSEVTPIPPPHGERTDVWINKTGSTNGFGTYVAFVPSLRIGVVLLANKSYPNEARVKAVYQIVQAVAGR